MKAGLNDSRLYASSFITGRNLDSQSSAERLRKRSLKRRRAVIEAPLSSSDSRERIASLLMSSERPVVVRRVSVRKETSEPKIAELLAVPISAFLISAKMNTHLDAKTCFDELGHEHRMVSQQPSAGAHFAK